MDNPHQPPTPFHSLDDVRTWYCNPGVWHGIPGSLFVWETETELVKRGIMSEPIHTRGMGKNSTPYLIEMPPNPVGIRMVPHMLASLPVDQGNDEDGNPIGEQAPLVKTGKLEVRFDGSSLPTKDLQGKPVDWEKVAYNAAHQTAYYRQVNDNAVARAEKYERKYTTALRDFESTSKRWKEACLERDESRRDMDRLRPLINSAFTLKDWWGYFLLPKSFRQHVARV